MVTHKSEFISALDKHKLYETDLTYMKMSWCLPNRMAEVMIICFTESSLDFSYIQLKKKKKKRKQKYKMLKKNIPAKKYN